MRDDYTKGVFARSYTVDMLGPAIGINPPGAAADPDRDPTTGWWLFDPTATELIYQSYQLPHGAIEGDLAAFEPHVHWHKASVSPASGTVAWRLRYRWANVGEVWTDWSDPITVTTPAVSDQNTPGLHALTTFGRIGLAGAKISACILCEISRVGSADTFDGDAVLTDADCHILINAPGSLEDYKKYHDNG